MKKKFVALLLPLVLVGCGSFPLGHVHAPTGNAKSQTDLDTLFCKDQAYQAANTAERQVGAFLAGLTIIGTPIAIEADKAKQREVFKGCMEGKGYRITPPTT